MWVKSTRVVITTTKCEPYKRDASDFTAAGNATGFSYHLLSVTVPLIWCKFAIVCIGWSQIANLGEIFKNYPSCMSIFSKVATCHGLDCNVIRSVYTSWYCNMTIELMISWYLICSLWDDVHHKYTHIYIYIYTSILFDLTLPCRVTSNLCRASKRTPGVATSFLRNNDVIITFWALWDTIDPIA